MLECMIVTVTVFDKNESDDGFLIAVEVQSSEESV